MFAALLLAAPGSKPASAGAMELAGLIPGGWDGVEPGMLAGMPQKFCALTFDDGPDATYTAQVKDILDGYGVKATFFVVGRKVEAHPVLVRELARMGHEIGNHTYSHKDMTLLSAAKQHEELAKANGALAALGIAARWFRPPYGDYNQVTLNVCAKLGLDPILWSLDPQDWLQPGVETIKRRVLGRAKSGAVILLHSTNPQTVDALPAIIEGLSSDGYVFLTLSDWFAVITGSREPPAIAYAKPALGTGDIVDEFFKPFRAGKEESGLPGEHLAVYSNFSNAYEAGTVLGSGQSSGLYYFPGSHAPRQSVVSSQLSVVSTPDTGLRTPDTIDTKSFRSKPPELIDGRFYPPPRFYFLSFLPDLDAKTLVELEAFLALARLSGVVLASEYGVPTPEKKLPYPWAYYGVDMLDRGSLIDLTVEDVADVMDRIKQRQGNIFVVVQPGKLHLFTSAHTLAEMDRRMRDFVLFRQLTAEMPYDPVLELGNYWELPEGVESGRFTDGRREVLVLYSRDKPAQEVTVPPQFAQFSLATIDAAGDRQFTRLGAGATVVVGSTPVILQYEYPLE